MKKTILTLIACITLLTSVTLIPANAALADPGETVTPLWDNTDLVNITVDYDENGYGYSECVVLGKSGVTKIVIEIVVYKQVGISWVEVAEKQEIFYNHYGASSCQYVSVTGATYKSTYRITVTKNGVDEIIEKNKITICE